MFRTSPGYNLLVRGPANWPKDGISPLEGVVETDWLGATFSVNWQMTRVNHEVIFERGEPIAMIVPQRRQEIESFYPAMVDIESAPEILHDYERWESQRITFIAEKKATLTVRVEDLLDSLESLCGLLGVGYRPAVAATISKTTHGRYLYINEAYWVIRWEELESLDAGLCRKIKRLATAYGY